MPRVSGLQLLERMTKHADSLGAHFMFARVISVIPMSSHFSITTSDEVIEARAALLATGVQRAKPFEGEEEFLGRGVSYCATCDGMLYRNSTVVVVGLGSEAVEEANFLAGIGAKVVFLATGKADAAGSAVRLQGLREDILVQEGRLLAIRGDMMGVTELLFREKATAAEIALPAQGVFILRDSIAPSALVAGLELVNDSIAVDARMRTNIAGVFAAGDCTGAPLQIAKAVGEGQLACFSAVEFLAGAAPDVTGGNQR
jgi:thioredoxin reductase (NADPH)